MVTVISQAPNGASEGNGNSCNSRAGEITRVLLTVMPVPLKDALVTPFTKLVSGPVMVTSRVDPDVRMEEQRPRSLVLVCWWSAQLSWLLSLRTVEVVVVTGAAVMVNAAGQVTVSFPWLPSHRGSYWRIRGNGNSCNSEGWRNN